MTIKASHRRSSGAGMDLQRFPNQDLAPPLPPVIGYRQFLGMGCDHSLGSSLWVMAIPRKKHSCKLPEANTPGSWGNTYLCLEGEISAAYHNIWYTHWKLHTWYCSFWRTFIEYLSTLCQELWGIRNDFLFLECIQALCDHDRFMSPILVAHRKMGLCYI